MKKILWLSRHSLTADQLSDLKRIYKEIEIVHVAETISDFSKISDKIAQADVLAVALPIDLQAQLLKIVGDKPVIVSRALVLAAFKGIEF